MGKTEKMPQSGADSCNRQWNDVSVAEKVWIFVAYAIAMASMIATIVLFDMRFLAITPIAVMITLAIMINWHLRAGRKS